MSRRWVETWTAMAQRAEPDNLPPHPFTRDGTAFAGCTVRQTIRVSAGGEQLRLRLSNSFGGVALSITAASVARPAGGQAGARAIEPGSCRPVTFHGRRAATIAPGAELVGDPVPLAVAPGANLAVTISLAQGLPSDAVTSHPGSRTTSYVLAGDRVDDADLPGAIGVDHWYFLSGCEVWAAPEAAAAVMLGDSLTDGRGSTTNGNDRWPDRLADRLHAQPGTTHVAIVNQAAGGNRVLHDGIGPNALSRLDRDVLARAGVAWLVVFEGGNDIGTAEATQLAQQRVAEDLIDAYLQLTRRAHARGIWVYGATLTPLAGNPDYDDPAGYRELTRQSVNDWIRTRSRFDAVLDFDAVTRDPGHPRQLRREYDTGDHLHLNARGYQAMADAVPLELFTPRPFPPDLTFD